MFDRAQLLQLRNDATLAAVDFKRARIEAAADGFVVHIDAPKVDISRLVPTAPPSRVETRSATAAEGEMLRALLTIQRAERQTVRGGIVGWTPEQIARRPLEPNELLNFQEKTAHAKKVAQLQEQLAEAIARRARAEEEQRAADELAEKYGFATSQPAKPKRATRSASK
ncbi:MULTISPECIES: hypothetical protein [Pseudomonas]|uniref:hypothetical protein n=1 Tax=Pseudomonas TaxID=286 RepID=UPI001AE6F49A|nr:MULTISPECIES: hypothetical protein [Pseudomonas]MBP2083517.1 multidrug resistance efflux pump [Pseudomonas sp. PvP089]MBP2090780.1 multidrug resistance efflux pump [Pseudomonas sp. PvP088]MBP2223056.1 multidrug resistance efflux pump [Pseudomonas putida]